MCIRTPLVLFVVILGYGVRGFDAPEEAPFVQEFPFFCYLFTRHTVLSATIIRPEAFQSDPTEKLLKPQS